MNQDKLTIRALIEAKDYQIAELKAEVDALLQAHAADKATVKMASAPGLRALLAERDKRIGELELQTQSDSKLLHDHKKWMKWCDIKVLEENEELSSLIHELAEALKQFSRHNNWCASQRSKLRKCDCDAAPATGALTKFNQWKESQT